MVFFLVSYVWGLMILSKKYVLSGVPSLKRPRSSFNLSHSIKGTIDVGTLVPIDVIEVLPGDTFKAEPRIVLRVTSSFQKPVIDNLFLDVYHFFVPNRLVIGWERIMGESDRAWAPSSTPSVPLMPFNTASSFNSSPKTVASAFGLPQSPKTSSAGGSSVSILPFRAFAKIYDDWFRDENLIDPMDIQKGSVLGGNEKLNVKAWSPTNYTGLLPKVSKLHDIFTASLPAPQKGNAIEVPLGTLSNVPVVTRTELNGNDTTPIIFRRSDGSGSVFQGAYLPLGVYGDDAPYGGLPGSIAPAASTAVPHEPDVMLSPVNLYTDDAQLGSISINDLRYAFQLQKIEETFARNGSRYVEMLQAFFGVTSPDARLQRSEFLGGKRVPVSVFQTMQTAPGASETDTPLASVAGWSSTFGSSRFVKSFTEHGYVITVSCIRQIHSYQQGIPKLFQRSSQYDFYLPTLANIGEQPIMTRELYYNSPAEQVFGYNEAWVHYRSLSNKVCGSLNSTSGSGLDIWHFGDNYSSRPILSKDFVEETPVYVDRTLTVNSSVESQFFFDCFYKLKATRVMPTYSVPGLIDHY